MTYDNIKSPKKTVSHPLSRRCICGKSHRGESNWLPSLLRFNKTILLLKRNLLRSTLKYIITQTFHSLSLIHLFTHNISHFVQDFYVNIIPNLLCHYFLYTLNILKYLLITNKGGVFQPNRAFPYTLRT